MLFHCPETTSPADNLALEEALWESLGEGGDDWFLLWRNAPCVVVGRHQATVREVNMAEVEGRGLTVVRRNTGGGAVYHDLGNLNFSFLAYRPGARRLDFGAWLAPIVEALADVGVKATVTGRNDIEAGGRKVSGSAQAIRRGRVLHHGTLLVNLDFEAMTRALHPDPEKYLSKGVASVRARVANIGELWRAGCSMEELRQRLVARCADREGPVSRAVLERAAGLARDKYASWDWNFGASPAFTERRARRFPWGRIEACLRVERGRIEACRFHGDFFSSRDVGELEERLVGTSREPGALEALLRELPLEEWFAGCTGEEVAAFIAGVEGTGRA